MISTKQLNLCSSNLLEATQVLKRLSTFWVNRAIASQERSELLVLKYQNPVEYQKLFLT
jgi:hypothetical protein